jgi:hypothetical protein
MFIPGAVVVRGTGPLTSTVAELLASAGIAVVRNPTFIYPPQLVHNGITLPLDPAEPVTPESVLRNFEARSSSPLRRGTLRHGRSPRFPRRKFRRE